MSPIAQLSRAFDTILRLEQRARPVWFAASALFFVLGLVFLCWVVLQGAWVVFTQLNFNIL